MAEKIADLFAGMPVELVTALLAALPLTELRGSIPFATFIFEMSWQQVLIWSIVGNIIPIPFILLLLGPAERMLSNLPIMKRFFEWLFTRTRKRGKSIEKYKAIGLTLFVGIPLPVTGAWTGAVAAYVFGIRTSRALPALTAGVIIAGLVVTMACQGVLGFWDLSQKFATH